MAGGPTTAAAQRSGLFEPELPTPTDDSSDPLAASLTGGALRASAHAISHLTVQRIGRRHSAVEHLINMSGLELSGLLFRPWHLEVRTPRGILDDPRGDVRVDVARPID